MVVISLNSLLINAASISAAYNGLVINPIMPGFFFIPERGGGGGAEILPSLQNFKSIKGMTMRPSG